MIYCNVMNLVSERGCIEARTVAVTVTVDVETAVVSAFPVFAEPRIASVRCRTQPQEVAVELRQPGALQLDGQRSLGGHVVAAEHRQLLLAPAVAGDPDEPAGLVQPARGFQQRSGVLDVWTSSVRPRLVDLSSAPASSTCGPHQCVLDVWPSTALRRPRRVVLTSASSTCGPQQRSGVLDPQKHDDDARRRLVE